MIKCIHTSFKRGILHWIWPKMRISKLHYITLPSLVKELTPSSKIGRRSHLVKMILFNSFNRKLHYNAPPGNRGVSTKRNSTFRQYSMLHLLVLCWFEFGVFLFFFWHFIYPLFLSLLCFRGEWTIKVDKWICYYYTCFKF